MIYLLRSIAEHLDIELRHLPLVVIALVIIVALGFLMWFLYWTWLVNFFAG